VPGPAPATLAAPAPAASAAPSLLMTDIILSYLHEESRHRDDDARRRDEMFHQAQANLVQAISADTKARNLPKLPKLSDAAGWPAFWDIVQHYLRHERYSPGGDGDLIEYPAGHEHDNSQASAALDLQLASSLDGDAKAHFIATGDRFTGKGFLKLAELKDKFGRTGLLDVARDLFAMLEKADLQASLTPTQYEKDLREQFLRFAEGGIKLPGPVQLMIMLRGLRSEYEPIREQFREGQAGRDLLTDELNAVTKWCDRYDGEFGPPTGRQNRHHARTAAKGGAPAPAPGGGGEKPPAKDAGGKPVPPKEHPTPWHWLGAMDNDKVAPTVNSVGGIPIPSLE